MRDAFERAVARLEPVSLEALDERAALRRRVDCKYVVSRDELAEVVEEVGERYEALEIDGRRSFDYESIYFDTPDLRCFEDHVEGRRPRFKIRTRLYRDSATCFLEVKVKTRDDETVKRQRPHDPSAHGGLDPDARRFLDEVLRECTGEKAPVELAPSLTTRYDRTTLGAVDGGQRVTCDADVRLVAGDGQTRTLRERLVLVETKTEEGGGPVDGALEERDHASVTISKYRLGVGMLVAGEQHDAFA